MQKSKTTFRKGYNPSFPEFKKTHGHIIPLQELEEAFESIDGKKLTKSQKEKLDKEINGDTEGTNGEGSEVVDNKSDEDNI